MTELSDYRRIVEKRMNEHLHREIDHLRAALADSTRILRLVIKTLDVTVGQRLTIEARIEENDRLGA